MLVAATTACYLACLAGAVETRHDPFDGAVPLRAFTFEYDEDLDFDGRPDDWVRRRGPRYPGYVEAAVDRERGHRSERSLRIDANGGHATMYSPLVPVDSLHSYVVEGFVRTQLLSHSAAEISVSFLDHKRQRVRFYRGRPVTGTHRRWVRIRTGPIAPPPGVRFMLIGCHLIQGKEKDIRGAAWFDNVTVGSLPQMSLVSNFHTHFKQRSAEIQITTHVSGLDDPRSASQGWLDLPSSRSVLPKILNDPNLSLRPVRVNDRSYRIILEMIDSGGGVRKRTVVPLEVRQSPANSGRGRTKETAPDIQWSLPPQEYGYYRVRAVLQRNRRDIIESQTSYAVMDLVEKQPRSEFGWSVSRRNRSISVEELTDVAGQSGIGWLKYPVWQSVFDEDPSEAARTAVLFERLTRRGIMPVGMLGDPPHALRRQFARDWTGISEIFTISPDFWSSSIEPVIARYSTNVRYWQLGSETDDSFVGMNHLGTTMTSVKRELDRIGRDTQIGVHWNWRTPLPNEKQLPHGFLSISDPEPLPSDELGEKLKSASPTPLGRWVLIRPLPRHAKYSQEERGTDLVKRMVAAKIGGAEAIFAADVFDPEHGLLHPDGSPTLLFLPWRTTALALRGAEFLGSLQLPGGSRNYLFSRDGEAVMVIWNDEPTVEEVYLGPRESVVATDVWGRQTSLEVDPATRRQKISVTRAPLIIRGCSDPIARWRLAVRFEKSRVKSRTGEHVEAVLGHNTFPQGVSGHVSLNLPVERNGKSKDWEVEPKNWRIRAGAGEPFRLPMLLTLPPDTSLGQEKLSIDFNISADRPYKIRVHRDYQVGLGDVLVEVRDTKLADGSLKIEQVILNQTKPAEVLDFACTLYIPNRRRQKEFVTKLGQGRDNKVYYIPDADSLRGKEMRLRAEQVGGRRILNYRWTVGQTPDWDADVENSKN